ncbi:hypothetical protein HYS54_04115 [Candidatus Micrarchaeota archaeon]|nr:hypothetical protein [Candidatus Micrarchaeota archaeon]
MFSETGSVCTAGPAVLFRDVLSNGNERIFLARARRKESAERLSVDFTRAYYQTAGLSLRECLRKLTKLLAEIEGNTLTPRDLEDCAIFEVDGKLGVVRYAGNPPHLYMLEPMMDSLGQIVAMNETEVSVGRKRGASREWLVSGDLVEFDARGRVLVSMSDGFARTKVGGTPIGKKGARSILLDVALDVLKNEPSAPPEQLTDAFLIEWNSLLEREKQRGNSINLSQDLVIVLIKLPELDKALPQGGAFGPGECEGVIDPTINTYRHDVGMQRYIAKLHAYESEDLEGWGYGSLADRQQARDFARGICGRLFVEEIVRPRKEAKYILTPERLHPRDWTDLQDLANQVRFEVDHEEDRVAVVPIAEDPRGQEKLWANFVLKGLDGNRLRQCYEIVCRRLYIPDATRASHQETCSNACAQRRFKRGYMKGYRKSRKKQN